VSKFNNWGKFFHFRTISRKFAEITRPRIVGRAMSPGAIYLVSTLADEIQLLCYQGNLTPVLNNLVTNPPAPENETSGQTRLGRKRLHTAIGCENQPPPSLSAFSKDPKRFLRNSLRRWKNELSERYILSLRTALGDICIIQYMHFQSNFLTSSTTSNSDIYT
jgi:hypothetical protein